MIYLSTPYLLILLDSCAGMAETTNTYVIFYKNPFGEGDTDASAILRKTYLWTSRLKYCRALMTLAVRL
jgi:hypothetical protein